MWHNHINYYINCMIDVDRHIGAVLDALEASGQDSNTITIFTSVHGEMAGAHHLRQKGRVAFKETVNVPLVIVDPRRPDVFDGRYKLVRYFGLAHYNQPGSVDELLNNNDVALYDLQKDPEEMNNLADPDGPLYDEELLAAINEKLNALIEAEIGQDKPLFEIQL